MSVDPQLQPLLDLINGVELPPLDQESPQQGREGYAALNRFTPAGPDLAEVRDVEIAGAVGPIGGRLYRPVETETLPLVVFFHGGGFVIGDLDTHDAVCRHLAQRSGAAVLAVDYRLAPEHPFPAAPDDCWAALVWAVAHADELGADATRVAVAGDSAGGNLAAGVAVRARDEGGPALVRQILVYPSTELADEMPSIAENGEGYLLTAERIRWFHHHYLDGSGADWADPRASVLRTESLAGVAPAMVITAEHDPLRDEGDAYAARLAAEGVPVEHVRVDGQIHGFFNMVGFILRADEIHELVAVHLRNAFDAAAVS